MAFADAFQISLSVHLVGQVAWLEIAGLVLSGGFAHLGNQHMH
jgi:hypothetical protein